MNELIEAVKEFIERCEKGEIRSIRSYNRFKNALEALQQADSTAPGAPVRNGSEEDQASFEAWIKREGKYDLSRSDDMQCEDGRFPATYRNRVTESCWRAWANKPAAPTAQQSTAGGTVPEMTAERVTEIWTKVADEFQLALRHAVDPADAGNLTVHFARAVEKSVRAQIATAPLPQVQSEALDSYTGEEIACIYSFEQEKFVALDDVTALLKSRSADTARLDYLLPNLHPANFGFDFEGGYEWKSNEEFLSKFRAALDAAITDQQPVTPSGALAANTKEI